MALFIDGHWKVLDMWMNLITNSRLVNTLRPAKLRGQAIFEIALSFSSKKNGLGSLVDKWTRKIWNNCNMTSLDEAARFGFLQINILPTLAFG